MISVWGLAVASNLKLSAVASLIAPYPTLSEISKRTAGSYYTPKLFGSPTKTLVRAIERILP
jgi:hypothetical protein